ncbi:MAG: flagellar biosynthesis protein FliQ [Gammaproteobacteria bacterium]|nr:flagellar biosynthesis protein FliQ [Gammaproteobacteria bacterium]MDH3449862.1 flagellar biosynthesis protein FliQ [Gammaproteobacteria bacterium]
MSPDTVIDLSQQALYLIALIAAPMLLSALAIGLLIGMFQAATSINEQTLSFIPKLMVLLLSILIAGPWMLNLLLSFTRRLYIGIPGLIG